MGKKINAFDSTSLLQYMFPKDMLKYFEITNAEEEYTGKYDETKTEIVLLHVFMDERDLRDEEWHDLKPNGFTEPRIIHDFPLRELKVVLHVRRRRWLAEDGGSVILNRIPLAADGTSYSAEFAAFLKVGRLMDQQSNLKYDTAGCGMMIGRRMPYGRLPQFPVKPQACQFY